MLNITDLRAEQSLGLMITEKTSMGLDTDIFTMQSIFYFEVAMWFSEPHPRLLEFAKS